MLKYFIIIENAILTCFLHFAKALQIRFYVKEEIFLLIQQQSHFYDSSHLIQLHQNFYIYSRTIHLAHFKTKLSRNFQFTRTLNVFQTDEITLRTSLTIQPQQTFLHVYIVAFLKHRFEQPISSYTQVVTNIKY